MLSDVYKRQLQSGKLKLPKAGWIRIKQHRSIDDSYTLKGATVSQEADDKYYVSLLYAAEKPEHKIRPVKTAIGLDFSMNELYVDSTGTHADYPHFFRKSQEKLAREQRRLSHCKKGSSRYMKQKKKIARLHAPVSYTHLDVYKRQIQTRYGAAKVKICKRGGVDTCYPEYESVRAICRETGKRFMEVFHGVMEDGSISLQ